MNLFCVGISHHTATVATRERYACEPTGAALQTTTGCEELLLLTTCNRVEVYAAATSPISTQAIAEGLLREVADCDIGRHVCFLSIRGGRVRKASVSRSLRSRFDGGGRDGDSRPGKKGGTSWLAEKGASGRTFTGCSSVRSVSRSKFAPTPKSRVAPCRSDRSQSISQKRFLEHWTIERFLFSAPEKRASARRARS